MREDDNGRLIVSPTDLTKFQACRHLTALDLGVARGHRRPPFGKTDEMLQLIFAKGLEHESRYLERLQATHDVVSVNTDDVEAAAAQTVEAMHAGAEVIYQATFLHDGRRGHADFLLRTAQPSNLGDWSFDVADTKLARRLKVPALLQMADYGEHLRRLQGRPPTTLTVVAGDEEQHQFAFADVEVYARRVADRFGQFIATPPATVADPVPHCGQCRWIADCYRGWRSEDNLTFVAFLGSRQRHELEDSGIATLAQLADSDPPALPRTIGKATRERIVSQAALQLQERVTGDPTYELLPPTPGQGLLKLPQPDDGDLYLDFESDRWVEPDGLEFLAGLGDRDDTFTPIWAHDADQERALTEIVIDRIVEQWQAHPGMHVYHYAPYEVAALGRLTSRHAVREAELDTLLRAEVFVDLYAVVRQGLRISKESYSIKKLEAFYWGGIRGQGDEQVADALSSVLEYERWIAEQDQSILDGIGAYNYDDVRSTHHLHDWLEQRRTELEQAEATVFARPSTAVDPAEAQPSDAELAEIALVQRLLAAGQPLLSGLVGWHRREARPGWWEFFRVEDLDDEELIEDRSALGGLGPPGHQYDVKRSHVHRYQFPPQDTALRPGDAAIDVDSHKPIGEVVDLDAVDGWVDIRIGKATPAATARGVGRSGPIKDAVLREAIAATAGRMLAGEDCLGARLLGCKLPPGLPCRTDETAAEAMQRIGRNLNGAVLAVQGPPGAGKTHNGAELIRRLLDKGLTVGVTALSHRVIGGLLNAVERPALHRCNDASQLTQSSYVTRASNTADVTAALDSRSHRLIGGTAWLWANADLRDRIDVLVIDEAGQFSLANAVAAASSAHSLVLLGDPQQLTQPTQAQHPHGAGVSALEHLLAGHDTVPPEHGVFLDRTWRMHPTTTSFVSTVSYEGRLESKPGLENQEVVGPMPWAGSGLRYLPVEHRDSAAASSEEAAAVAETVGQLLDCTWTDEHGVTLPLTTSDILVVAPYNAHVARIRAALRDDVAVGTVDKFQGAEAAVVIYSLASSSARDAPRGIDFLYDIHRLNVAVSRARALTILVCSPALLDAEATTPEQVRRVNALCRYVESAQLVRTTDIGRHAR